MILRQFCFVLLFLTRLRIPFKLDFAGITLARAAWAFPLAGLAVGGVAAAVFAVAEQAGLGGGARGWLAVIAALLITGGLHEDGLADTADGLAFGRDRERKLEIMRDSRIGSYGVLALVAGVSLRASLIGALMTVHAIIALLLAASLSRSAMAWLMGNTPFARAEGLAANAGAPDSRTLLMCLFISIVVATALTGIIPALVLLMVAAAVAYGVRFLALRHFGGITGDVLGAAQQLTEIALLIALTLLFEA